MLLEKAWAKLHGSYSMIISGTSQEALAALTQKPTKSFSHDKEQEKELWREVLDGTDRTYLMEVATCGSVENLATNGLISGHTYSLLGAQDVTLSDGSSVRFIKIRNP